MLFSKGYVQISLNSSNREEEKMSKEYLEAKPEDISKLLYEVYDVPSGICEQIKNMAQRLESIDNANPSEALECLEALEQDIKDRVILAEDRQLKLCAIIQRALQNAQKENSVLEIIKEKNVNMFGFKRDIKQLGNRFTYKYYQSNLGNYHSGFDIQELTEE